MKEVSGLVNNESFLKWPTPALYRTAEAWLHDIVSPHGQKPASITEDHDTTITIQWFVALGTSYLILAGQEWPLSDPLPLLLIALCLVSATTLQRLPESVFKRQPIQLALLAIDSILIIAGIGLTQHTPWDLLLLFFFCVFIATTGENLLHIAIGCALLSIVFVFFEPSKEVNLFSLSPPLLMRVPFMFGISIFYGHLANQLKLEKKRVENLIEKERTKRQLVCSIAHDIKAPLSVILGHAELLAGYAGGVQDPEERRSRLQRIRDNIDRILKLVTDFLDVSRLESAGRQASRSLVQMNVIAEEIAAQQMAVLQDKSVRLNLDLDQNLKPVVGDQSQLERVLWNLINNAVKFTPSGSISVISRMVGNRVCVQVKDTGIGIAQEDLSALFSEFRRLKGSANTEGTGLGLFIVKTFVEAHEGSVAVESQEGIGTTFTVLLPLPK